MVMGNCMPGDEQSATRTAEAISAAAQAFVEALGKVRSGSDDEKPEPGLVSIRKEVTTYDFNIEGVTKAIVEAISTFFPGSTAPEDPLERARVILERLKKTCGSAEHDGPDCKSGGVSSTFDGMADYVRDHVAGEPPMSAEEALESYRRERDAILAAAKERHERENKLFRTSPLETPDGKLQSEFASLIATSLLGEEPDEQSVRQALEVVNVVVSEQHRAQLLEELARASGMRLGSAGGAVVSDWLSGNKPGQLTPTEGGGEAPSAPVA